MADQNIIYIVDDDANIGVALENLLKAHGFRPRVFASIADFHSKAKPHEAVCLILDIQMNGAGFDLKRQLSFCDPGLPVIFITGSDTEENRSTVQQSGGAAYLPKPFGSKTLLDAIHRAERSASSTENPVDAPLGPGGEGLD